MVSVADCPSCGAARGSTRYCGWCGFDLTSVAVAPASIDPGLLAPVTAGTLLAGRLRISGVLAVGSMGTVYAATDEQAGGEARAIKELLEPMGTAEERIEAEAWFYREGMTLRSLVHPAIPRVHDLFSQHTRHYLVMDLVEGQTLEQLLASEGQPGLDETRVVTWADQVLDVLSYLHSLRDPVIFRDLKPANLMLTPSNQIRLIDFGIARVFTRIAPGTAIGTPGYAPPEQYQGLAEPASDLYALGATIYHLLTGRDPRTHRPFDFPPIAGIAPWLSPHVAGAVDRALVLDPRRRFDTAADMYRALHAPLALERLPRLTVALQAPSTQVVAIPPLLEHATVCVYVGPLEVLPVPSLVRLEDGVPGASLGGITLVCSADRQRFALHNQTDERMSCALISSVPGLQPVREVAWLEPHGMVELELQATVASRPFPAPAPSDVSMLAAGPVPTAASRIGMPLPIVLQVRGLAVPTRAVRLSVLPGIVPISIVGLSSLISLLTVAAFRWPLFDFYLFECPALILAILLQSRRRYKA